mmetsp:Transcript_12684/g.32859  ORF Transcript_12684/g.32859 Transcript_12684/m.32859 type:complete len:95 (+) Transcript_12684:141-425(+)
MLSEAVIAHRVRVMRLYRHSLKQMASWAVQRSLFYVEAEKIRSQFEANKNVVRGGGSFPFRTNPPSLHLALSFVPPTLSRWRESERKDRPEQRN